MKHNTMQQLRDNLKRVLKRARPKSLKKLKKAYHGKRLKKWWSDYANADGCVSIAELKDFEGVGHRMNGGHHHRRNYCICSVCGKWFRRNKGRHYDYSYGTYHFCCGPCDVQAQFEADLDADVGGGFEPHYWDDEGDAEWRSKKKMKVDKRCLNCKHEGRIHERQGWGGDEYWCERKQGMPERDRRSFGCEKWESK